MWLLKLIFSFVAVQVISCDMYDLLMNDECFKATYLCGEARSPVTDANDRLPSGPLRFSEMCRDNKEFMACIQTAVLSCAEKLTPISKQALNNRLSLYLYCTDNDWKSNYFRSVDCINSYEKTVTEECIEEEYGFKDEGRPFWCLIPEPCESLERVTQCNIRKMGQLCGPVAAEVYRRMDILKKENRDIVCIIRQRNPLYCRYDRKRPSETETVKRMGSLYDSLSEAINKVFEVALADTMDHFRLVVNEENLSNLLDSEEYKLRKALFKKEFDTKFGPYLKKCKNLEGEFSQLPDLSAKAFGSLYRNIKETFLSEASHANSRHTLILYGNVLRYCGSENIAFASCLAKFKELKASLNPDTENSNVLDSVVKSLKAYILGLFELLNCNEDVVVNFMSEKAAVFTWSNLNNNFPLEYLSCRWKNKTSDRVFQCSFSLNSEETNREERQSDIIESTTGGIQNVNSFIRSSAFESSPLPDLGSGMPDNLGSIDESGMLDSTNTEIVDYESDVFDIHRRGEVMFQEEIDSEDTKKEIDDELKLFESEKDLGIPKTESGKENAIDEEWILVDGSHLPTDSVSYFVVDKNSNAYLDSRPNTSEFSKSIKSGEEIELEKSKLPFDKIVDALTKRFANLEKYFVSNEYPKRDSREGQELEKGDYSNESENDNENKIFQKEVNEFLKENLDNYNDVKPHYPKLPLETERKILRTRFRRQVVSERPNSKMSKGFTTEAPNSSQAGRENSKFMNFQAEL